MSQNMNLEPIANEIVADALEHIAKTGDASSIVIMGVAIEREIIPLLRRNPLIANVRPCYLGFADAIEIVFHDTLLNRPKTADTHIILVR